jgi:transglutaminase-like putative cysteine protease
MQALDVFDGRTWRASSQAPRLPQPAGERTRIEARVRGLLNSLVVAPGRIEHIAATAAARTAAGGAWELWPAPEAGDEYAVESSVVRADARRLRRARHPLTRGVAAYTRLGWTDPRTSRTGVRRGSWDVLPTVLHDLLTPGQPAGFPVQVRPFGRPPSRHAERALASSPYHRVAALARRLAAGARTEWDVVARVQSYLGGHRFRYTTDVAPPGELPLVDFLLRTHAGHCQHFAGAAALLLRMAGVPARMVTGFATGQRTERGYVVRDVDAHAWIEVYFEDVGWVPFDPTPPADAPVARERDSLAATRESGGRGGGLAGAIVVALAAAALAGSGLGRRPTLENALARLAARTGTPIHPSTTLAELRRELARTVGGHTSALAAEAERARFGPRAQRRLSFPRARVARALVHDAGLWRAVRLVLPVRAGAVDHAVGVRATHTNSREPPARTGE